MKKTFFAFLTIFVFIYTVLFTKIGNTLLISPLETFLNQNIENLNIKIENLELKPNHLNTNLILNAKAKVNLNGEFDIFKQNIELKYKLTAKDLSKFEKLLNRRLQKDLSVKGNIVGDREFLVVDGKAKANENSFEFATIWSDFNLSDISFNFQNAKVSNLLESLDYPKYASAKADISTKGLNFIDNQIFGEIDIKAENLTIFRDSLEEFNISLKKNLTFNNLNAKVSDGIFEITLRDLNSTELINSIGEYPNFIDTNIDIAKISHNILKRLTLVKLKTTNSIINTKVVNREFDLNISKDINFDSYIGFFLRDKKVLLRGVINSNIATLKIEDTIIDLNNNNFKGNYELFISDLEKLKFLTKKSLRGDFDLKGEVKKIKEFSLKGESKTYGKTSLKYQNRLLNINIKDSNLKSLTYPFNFELKFLDTNIKDLRLSHDLGKNITDIKVTLNSLKFLTNRYTKLLNRYLHFDFAKEKFEDVILSAKLKKDILSLENSEIIGKKSKLKIKNFKLNTTTKEIYTKIDIEVPNFEFGVLISGDIKKPNVKIDLSEMTKGVKKPIILLSKALVFPIEIIAYIGIDLSAKAKERIYDIQERVLSISYEATKSIEEMFGFLKGE